MFGFLLDFSYIDSEKYSQHCLDFLVSLSGWLITHVRSRGCFSCRKNMFLSRVLKGWLDQTGTQGEFYNPNIALPPSDFPLIITSSQTLLFQPPSSLRSPTLSPNTILQFLDKKQSEWNCDDWNLLLLCVTVFSGDIVDKPRCGSSWKGDVGNIAEN